MVWIGIYIAIASCFCIFAMATDLVHGFRNKRFWFPSKYFTLNAASITVISVAMKLPVDLNSGMPSYIDQAAKLGSLAFMCTMMANLMPSLASMNNTTLFANVIGLSILAITMIVNVIIQITASVISDMHLDINSSYLLDFNCVKVAYIYTTLIFVLLIIIISSSLSIPTSKDILEFKYQETNKTLLTDQRLQHTQMSMVEKLKQYVTRYWVMAETGSPQFVMASSPVCTASGVICVLVLLMHLLVVLKTWSGTHDGVVEKQKPYGSPYKRSILAIVITQSIGVVVGTIAPIFRCFSVLNYRLITEWTRNYLMFFEVEKYWTQRLYDWKQSHIPILSSSRRSRTFVYNLKNTILGLWIRFQKVTVVLCKVIWLIPIVFLRFVVYCVNRCKSLKMRLFTPPISPGAEGVNEELRNYVLQIHNEMELAENILKGILNSINSFILKAEKKQNENLQNLLGKSTGFNGVTNFDNEHVQSLLPAELVNSWGLPIVTMTCIAISLPNIHKDRVESLVKSVGEGLWYTYHVEETLNSASEYVNIRNSTMTICHEVENNCKWLKNALGKDMFSGKTTTEIVKWFAEKAKDIVIEIKESTNGEMVQKPSKSLIAANSMYRVAETILLTDQRNTELHDEQLFVLLNDMIADIFSACFTNIPRVIITKCQESVIEKREASVKVAAKLLGETKTIIQQLRARELPGMDPDKMAYIDEWRHYLKQSIS
uniref:uncharacterized protein LOC122610925 n=1 Tax=Erigeron canadensis TaxID=72917 RepID=UPI001CB8A57A|nr:uncharacterized protein LOC122610925 [Erigeron canadensis]